MNDVTCSLQCHARKISLLSIKHLSIFTSASSAAGLFAAASLVALPVHAQSGATANNAGALEEVVVTAQRRSERALNVPISIATIDANQLGQGDVQQLGDITKFTPGMRFDNLGANAQPTIRGVGTAVVVAGAGSNVALYTDGFYSPSPLMADSELLNVQSVQVLKGPQGTLFGRNATGGAILVTTTDPSSEAAAELQASYGSYDTQRYQVYATGGPSDALAFDVAGLYRTSDGYLDNILDGSDKDGEYEYQTVRAGTRWQISDRVSALLRYAYADGDDPAAVAVNSYEEDGQVYATAATFGAQVATKPHDVASNFKPRYTSIAESVQLKIKADLDFATLTSYTQYRDESGTHYYDFDASPLSIYHYIFETTDKILTQEFLLSSTQEGPLQWTTGLFYFVDETEYPHNRASIAGDPFSPLGGSGVEANSVAVFGDATYALTERLFLTLGMRYSADEITDAYYIDGEQKIDVPDLDDERVTPRAALRFEINDKSNVYVSYSEGFKSGILNVAGNTLEGIKVDPEEVQAYEVGYKYASGPLMLDVAVYYYDYKGLQVASYAQTQSFIKNAADSTIRGIDAQTRYAFTEQFGVNAGLSYLKAEYDDFDESQFWNQCLDAVNCGEGYGVFLPSYGDASGNEIARSPRLTGSLGLDYKVNVAEGSLDLSGTWYHTSDFYFDSSNLYKQEDYDLLSMRASWTNPSHHYTVALYGDNLTDEEYRSQVLPQFYGPLSTWGAPRTFGVSVNLYY
jgi:iron complex outermembrane receptor protein